jgi:molybdopterin molybdotransferase
MTPPQSPRDVRMRGFTQRHTVREAWDWVDALPVGTVAEPVPLSAACGRVLAADVVSGIDVPGFDRSAMDGYAVLGDETAGASDYNPLLFEIVGTSLPGRGFDGEVHGGEAVRIMTGAPLPAGADAVVPAEYAREIEERVELTTAVPPLKNIGRVGEDIAAGECVLSRGRHLRPQDVGVAASLGRAELPVVRQPRVRLLVTGDELKLPGEPKDPHEIYEANSFMLRGLVARDGGVFEEPRRLPDQRDRIRDALLEPGADVILVSGGSSVGAEDHAPTLLAEEGELAIHGIAMRPSSPAGMGRLAEAAVFLLPGNPVSCLCAYDFFAGRAIRRLAGLDADWPYERRRLPLRRKIVSAIGRVDYCRVRVTDERVEPLALSGASILSSTTRADGFVIVPAESEGQGVGSDVEVFLYD